MDRQTELDEILRALEEMSFADLSAIIHQFMWSQDYFGNHTTMSDVFNLAWQVI